jgi:archaellum component FlaG (FlaF/FlaG flagellin family)
VNNNDGFLEGGRDLYVTIYMENEIVFVTHGPGDNEIGVWHWNTAKVPNVSEDDIENGYLRNLYHHWYPPGFNDNTEGYTMCCGSARILFEIGIAYDFLENNCSDNNEDLDEDGYTRDRWNQPKIEARWPSTGGDSFFDNYYVEYGYEYDPKDGYERDAFKRDVVLHEYSHAVMWKLYGNHWPNGGPYILKHWLTLDTNPHTALVEGWAEYLPNVIQKDDNHRGNNVETENFYATRYDQNKSWNGNSIEGAVLNILYDLSDDSSYNDLYPWSDDDEIHNFDEVWRIMRDYNPDALVDYSYYTNDFWDQWNSGHQQELWEIFYNHGINKDSQPPSISNIYHLPDSPTSSQDVDVYANVMDNLSGIKDVTCFYKVNESEYHELEMSIAEYATLGGYQFTAQIPVQGPGSEVKYHIEAEDNAGQHYRTFTFQYTVQEENSQPQLNVYPTSHNFGTMNEGETATWTFYIENTGGGELTWEIKEDLSWISVNRSDGTTTEIDSITVTANTTGLTPGDYSGYIYVISDGEEAQIYVEVTVSEEASEEPPQIYVHPTSHNFGTMNEGETATWTFYIENTGGGELKWLMVNSLPWLTVTPLQGTTTTEIDSVTVTVNTTGLNCGTHYEGAMAIMTNGSGTPRLSIEVTIADCSNPQIYVDPTSHNFGTMNEGETATCTFYIENSEGEPTCPVVTSLPRLTVARKVELLPQRLILSPFTLLDSGRVLQWKHLHNTPKS